MHHEEQHRTTIGTTCYITPYRHPTYTTTKEKPKSHKNTTGYLTTAWHYSTIHLRLIETIDEKVASKELVMYQKSGSKHHTQEYNSYLEEILQKINEAYDEKNHGKNLQLCKLSKLLIIIY